VPHIVALPFTLKSILRRKKKNYENSNIFTMPKYNVKKNSSKRNEKILHDIITLYNKLISSFNTSQNGYHLSNLILILKNKPIIYYLGAY
jgi:hypothetical protein